MSADPITDQLEEALDSSYDEQFEFYLASLDESDDQGSVDVDSTVPVGTQFQIGDQAAAEWALRKIRRAERFIAETDEATQVQVDAIMAKATELCAPLLTHQQDVNATHEETVRFFTGLLNTYHRKLIAADPTRKTIKLAFGTLTARKQPDVWTFDDETFIAWATENGFEELVRVKEEVDKPVAKAKLKAAELSDGTREVVLDGQIALGVTVEPGDTKFSISTEVATKTGSSES